MTILLQLKLLCYVYSLFSFIDASFNLKISFLTFLCELDEYTTNNPTKYVCIYVYIYIYIYIYIPIHAHEQDETRGQFPSRV